MIRSLPHPGDVVVVLDPFMGSGSTAVACKMLGRHYVGYEISPIYCAEAQARIDAVKIGGLSELFEGDE